MKKTLEEKLYKISRIWNNYILEYKNCRRNIKFNNQIRANYYGEITGYFIDTFPIVFKEKEPNSFSEIFSYHISLLQCIYVQQDLIEELLIIFKCKIAKGDLKEEPNYYLNRNIRNELVGHPIRRHEGRLKSTCLFSYESNKDKIKYIRYHEDTGYNFEMLEWLISDIVLRHYNFLNTYFDIILEKLKGILKNFKRELEKFTKQIQQRPFNEILKLSSIEYESIFNSEILYTNDNLLNIYSRRKEHNRYQNVIDSFYSDLKNSVLETLETIEELIDSDKENPLFPIEEIEFEAVYVDSLESELSKEEEKITYDYELGKLVSKDDFMSFKFHSDCLKTKCKTNKLVLDELQNMNDNFDNDIEYYSSFMLIYKELVEDEF